MWTPQQRRARIAAGVVASALVSAGLGTTSAVGLEADRKPYAASEIVPTGSTPPEPKSGYAGQSSNAPTIAARSETFGRVAARSGIGLKTYRYSEDHGNFSTLDLYTPRAFVGRHNRQVRTVILVHGGAWQMGDRIDMEDEAVQLAKLGFVVVSINYRLAIDARWPAQRDDVNAAIKYVRAHAKHFNIDNKRTVLIGSSAGGQIAAAVATAGAGSKRFRGLVTLSGLVSPLLMAEKDPSFSNSVIPDLLLRCLPADCPTRYRSATALTQLDRRDMPSLLFHSKLEKPWSPAQAREFVKASRAVGVDSKLVVLSGMLHGIDAWPRLWKKMAAWLLETLGTTDRT